VDLIGDAPKVILRIGLKPDRLMPYPPIMQEHLSNIKEMKE